jgi:endonuclease III
MPRISDRLHRVNQLLSEAYGPPPRTPLPFGNKKDPLDELIFITLSQRTHGPGTDRAFENLKARFSSWDEVAEAPLEEITRLIEPSGLAFLKAPRILRILRDIVADRGSCDLSFLHECSDDQAYAYLQNRLRAGYKTTWCVMLYSLSRDVFPADVHALRVLRRLGLLPTEHRHETVNRRIHDFVPPGNRYELHVNLILHGRAVCRERPACGQCVLKPMCPWAAIHSSGEHCGDALLGRNHSSRVI